MGIFLVSVNYFTVESYSVYVNPGTSLYFICQLVVESHFCVFMCCDSVAMTSLNMAEMAEMVIYHC